MGCTSSTSSLQTQASAACGLDGYIDSDLKRDQRIAREKFDQQQHKANESQPRIVRTDLSAKLTSFHLAKNRIELILVSQLLFPMIQDSALCQKSQLDDVIAGIKSRDIIIKKNPAQSSEEDMDEAYYCLCIAIKIIGKKKATGQTKQPLEILIDILHVFKQLQLQEAKWSNSSEENQVNWFERYSRVLVGQLISLTPYVELLLQVTSTESKSKIRIVEECLFSVVVYAVRFFEGINWGYSDQLPHHELDQATYKALIVMFNIMQKFKQSLRGDKEVGRRVCSIENQVCSHHSLQMFLSCTSYLEIDMLVTFYNGRYGEEEKTNNISPTNYEILGDGNSWFNALKHQPIYKYFYRKAKAELLSWLSSNKSFVKPLQDVTLESLEQIIALNATTHDQDFLQRFRLETDGKFDQQQSNQFQIDNSDSIFVIQSPAWESQLIIESFLQEYEQMSENTDLASDQSTGQQNQLFKCLLFHCCIKRNRITCDTYYIMKHIVFQLSRVPVIRDFLLMQPDNQFKEFTTQMDLIKLQISNAHTFVAFLKVISQIKIDYNLVVFLHGIENVYSQNDLENFVFVLRSASHIIPPFLKFVFSIERRTSNFSKIDKTLKLLMSHSTILVEDSQYWNLESQKLLKSVQQYQNLRPELATPPFENVVATSVFCEAINERKSYKTLCLLLVRAFVQCDCYPLENQTLDQLVTPEKDFVDLVDLNPASLAFLYLMTIIQGPISHQLIFLMFGPQLIEWESTFNKYLLIFQDPPSHEQSTRERFVVPLNQKFMSKSIRKTQIFISKKQSPEYIHKNLFAVMMQNQGITHEGINYDNYQYQRLGSYFKNYFHIHLKQTGQINWLPTCAVIHKQLLWFRSFSRLIQQYQQSIQIDSHQNTRTLVNLRLVGQTLLNEDVVHLCDFYTQMKGRDMFTESQCETYESVILQFDPIHQSLKENQRLEHIIQFPPSPILSCRFLSDNQRVVFSLACGLCLLLDTVDLQVQKVFVISSACLDLVKVVEDKYLILAGLSDKVRLFNLDTEKLIFKFQPHSDQSHVNLMQIGQNMFYSYSGGEIVKWDLKKREKAGSVQSQAPVLKMKLRHNGIITCQNKKGNFIIMYDLDLNLMFQTSLSEQPQNIKKFLSLSQSDCLVYNSDGSLVVVNTDCLLEVVRKGSIFNLKSEDCIDILLIKSKDNYMFTIEKHKMDFFTVSTFKKSDSWDYFFPRAITGCGKNREGSKICVWDSSSTLSLFNFLKNVDKRQKSQVAPSHRRQDQIQCLDVHNDQIVTCSLDRELRVWDMDGKFIKKYDLTSFTNEALICMKMTQSGMLFLGSKDLNVYLVDVLKGKLCVVYEGHWSRVNLISQVLDKDILITVSESNIKVWDLEYDECIKNMNEHKSQVIYCESSHTNQRNIVTISQDYEYKEWSYTTAVVEKAEILKLPEGSHLVAADLSPENLGFFALDSHQIVVYDFDTKQVLESFQSHNQEDVIFLKFLATSSADYLIVTTRTSCICYMLSEHQLNRLAAYILNANKTQQQFTQAQSKYSYSSRFYFTSCKVLQIRYEVKQPQYDQRFDNDIQNYQRPPPLKLQERKQEVVNDPEPKNESALELTVKPIVEPKVQSIDVDILKKKLVVERITREGHQFTVEPSHKEEAIDKLEATNDNPLRYTDIPIFHNAIEEDKGPEQKIKTKYAFLIERMEQEDKQEVENQLAQAKHDEYQQKFSMMRKERLSRPAYYVLLGDSRGILHMTFLELI